MEEIWRDIPNYEGLYQVSNLGKVKNKRNNKLLKYSLKKDIKRYELWKNNKKHSFKLNELLIKCEFKNPNKVENLPNEIWKEIEGFNNYQISNLGRIKNTHYHRSEEEKLLKVWDNGQGYNIVELDGKTYKVHRLVATAFIPNPEGKPCIDHINTIRNDNRVENLRWVTRVENMNNKISLDHMSKASKTKWEDDNFKERTRRNISKGQRNSAYTKKKCKPIIQYSLDWNKIKVWDCMRDIERELGIAHNNVSKCCIGEYNQAGGYRWKFKKWDDIRLGIA